MNNATDSNKMIIAEVSPKSKGDHSLFDVDVIDETSVENFVTEPGIMADAIRKFQDLGFEIGARSDISFTIRGPLTLYKFYPLVIYS